MNLGHVCRRGSTHWEELRGSSIGLVARVPGHLGATASPSTAPAAAPASSAASRHEDFVFANTVWPGEWTGKEKKKKKPNKIFEARFL